jgi:hypothetical protein
MKKIMFLSVLLLCITIKASAQIVVFKATTGDVEMDAVLTDVHDRALKDIAAFKSDVSISFNIPIPKIEASLKILPPGDVFMAAQLSLSVNKPFDDVVATYQKNKSKGWGALAKEMGIKPGSPEFHAMKKSMKSKGASKAKPKDNSAGSGNNNSSKGKGKKK